MGSDWQGFSEPQEPAASISLNQTLWSMKIGWAPGPEEEASGFWMTPGIPLTYRVEIDLPVDPLYRKPPRGVREKLRWITEVFMHTFRPNVFSMSFDISSDVLWDVAHTISYSDRVG